MNTASADGTKTSEQVQSLTVDGAITYAGEYGRFQILVNAIFCLMTFPAVFHIMLPYFAADNVDWKCAANSTKCHYNGTFSYKDKEQNKLRCGSTLSRSDWEFVTSRDYSVVTQFDIVCDKEWILETVVAIFFVGWIIGSVILGWFSDNYGRKLVIFVSLAIIMVIGVITPLLPNVYAFIFCRLVTGFFIPGTYQLMIILMTEIVGSKYRAFAGNIIFVFATSGMALLGLKAYLIREWKTLYLACTAPYLVVLLFYKFVPESLRTLAIKGKTKELNRTLHRMAKFNNQELPSKFVVTTDTSVITSHNSNPLDLFKSKKLAKKTLCQSLGYVVGGLTFYGLYLAAKDIGNSKYRDFVLVTMSEIPFALLAIAMCERFGRKKTVLFFYGIGTLSCFGLCFAPKKGDAKVLRILLGMLGKCSVGPGYNTLQTWTMELYPTYVRGEAMGALQAVTRLGAAVAPFVDMQLSNTAAFIFFGCLTFASMCLLPPLKEMKGQDMGETESEAGNNFEIMQDVELKDKVEMNGTTNAYNNDLYDIMNPPEDTATKFDEIDKSCANSAVNELYDKMHQREEVAARELTVL